MTQLRDLLERRDAGVRDRLLPTHFRDLRTIRPDARIRRALESLQERAFVGLQYEYLARFAQELGLDDLELGIHHDTSRSGDYSTASPRPRPMQGVRSASIRQLPEQPSGPYSGASAFRCTSSRSRDAAVAEERGVADLMALT